MDEKQVSKGSDFGEDDEQIAHVPRTLRKRLKVMSDLTGLGIVDMVGESLAIQGMPAHRGGRRAGRKQVSDLTIMVNLPPEVIKQQQAQRLQRQRELSSGIVKSGYLPNLAADDLKMAEKVTNYGTSKEQEESGAPISMEEEEFADDGGDFTLNEVGLSTQEAEELFKQWGPNELPSKETPKWLIFLQQFWAPMPIMIWIAIIIEAAIKNWVDMAILLFIQFTNASISFYETNKAGNAVAALKSSLKPSATCKRDGEWKVMDSRLLVPGDLVLLGSGSAIPADCRCNASEIDVDQAALTGESLPVTFFKYGSVKMGSTVVRGEVEATVEFTGGNSFLGKTASLLEDTHELSHLQMILIKVMIVLVALSITLCGIYFIYLLTRGVDPKHAISLTVVVLVASIPLAMEIVTTTTLAIGSKKLVAHGAIVAKLSAIEDLAGMSILCSDKTGTLTLNKMMLQDDTPMYRPGETQESVLMYAAIAAKWKEPARDALDRLTLGNVNMSLMENFEQLDYMPFDPTTKRTEGTVKDKRTGEVFKASKGAPHIILSLLGDGAAEIKEQVEKDVARLGECGTRSLAVARTVAAPGGGEKWVMLALLTFLDPPRPDTKHTIEEANRYGVDVKMITGDHYLIAVNTANVLAMGDRIFTAERLPMLDPETKQKPAGLSENYGDLCLVANGFSQVFPEHKYLIVECLRELGYTVGMTGDGVNDAPALKRADIGIAVAGATDAARAAADIILTEEGLGTIIHGIIIAREIFQRISNFMTYRIAATLQLLVFFFISLFAFQPQDYEHPSENGEEEEDWPEFFYMPVIMLMLITLLNDGTLITIAYDRAKASQTPDRWNLPVLGIISSMLGAVSCFSSLLILHFLLDSWNPNGFFASLGMKGVDYGQITTAIYLKVSVSDFLTLFSARTGPYFFWKVPPAGMLFAGGCIALLISSILAITWPTSVIDEVPVAGLKTDMGLFVFVWLYCLAFFIIQDCFKVLTVHLLMKTNFNGYTTTGVMVLPESAKRLIDELDKALADQGPSKHH